MEKHEGPGELEKQQLAFHRNAARVMVSGELSVICRSKPNKIKQANLFQGHSGFPQAIKMFKPLNISDLFSCIPRL